ncbi:MAG: cytochrome c3 family protein [Desulfuromusa sp.]|jgi:predicted CXXCH cytochrome family protein|nr:cytochrome c3 family protein [Desulfuromusa sp.]
MRLLAIVFLLCFSLASCGDPVTNHKILSTIFDGVPSLPPAGEMCNEYYQERVAAEVAGQDMTAGEAASLKNKGSSHKPYAEKKCRDCHSNDKNVNAGLISPKRELCVVCHIDFIKGSNVHGPVAVGDCLACHLPHSSQYPSLLKEDPDSVCAICHQESRLAAAMHDRFVVKTISCGECHDPHAGDARYFLK